MTTYPEMNEKIIELLRLADEGSVQHYAADRIEELERELKKKNSDVEQADVKKIVLNYLQEKKFDGLCQEDCGCFLDDLMPCGEWCGECKAGVIGVDEEGNKIIEEWHETN